MLVGVIDGEAMAPGDDVCKTQVGPAVVPIPYPNIWDLTLSEPLPTILIDGTPAMNLECMGDLTQGDEAGIEGGIISSEIMGEGQCLTGAENVLLDGAPAVIMGGSTTMQNSENAPGDVMLVAQMIVSAI
ncbi:DUF4150 domain-containing protein [Thiotrichales bacterium 19X7-9]|nr:DUF4150 domain-containing protein [Thiotrichales bacterium 19X7-9]TNF67233.1 MAG: DUF4150 domain-containing protein [Gammaproteobacteria bacterium]UTW42699.1 DUF4150 domain-containing protein [bacterium SCSIO 12844]